MLGTGDFFLMLSACMLLQVRTIVSRNTTFYFYLVIEIKNTTSLIIDIIDRQLFR